MVKFLQLLHCKEAFAAEWKEMSHHLCSKERRLLIQQEKKKERPPRYQNGDSETAKYWMTHTHSLAQLVCPTAPLTCALPMRRSLCKQEIDVLHITSKAVGTNYITETTVFNQRWIKKSLECSHQHCHVMRSTCCDHALRVPFISCSKISL